ncbi:hypothetical protein IFM89_005784 [Coptis chinensis]|uniref:Uncharacterized protein n=1 Tax=Coptis chinensis TaxID=261450 RepID=A0A835IJX6_9MAGN|nr:hypothetical protein IFM89_005784 [Coptis chinensis]
MEALKKAANNDEKPLVSVLVNSFEMYACEPTPYAYSFVVKSLFKSSQLDQLPCVLDHMRNVERFEPPERIFVEIIRIYGCENRIRDAVDMFFKIPSFRCNPSSVSLNALLSVLCKRKEGIGLVHQVLLKSRGMNIRLEESTFEILITALCKLKKIGYAVEILDSMSEYGYDPDSTLYSRILSAMCKLQDVSSVEVWGFLEEMRAKRFTPNEVDYANVVSFLVKVGKGMDALDLMEQMKLDRIKPDVVVYTCVLDGVITAGDFDKVEEVFDEMLVLGVVPDVHTYNVYLKGLCMQNSFEAGFKLVACMEELGCKPDVSTYNTLMGALCKVGKVMRAKEVLTKMRLKGLQRNLHSYSILINGLMCEGEVGEACEFWEDMLTRGFVPMSLTCDEMICGLCKLGLNSEALRILKQMVEMNIMPGVSAWEALLSIRQLHLNDTVSLDLEDYFQLSYHKFNESQREESILKRLQEGDIVALISDAGTPGISDPGTELAKLCVKEKIPVIPIPGPSALVAALSASGLSTVEFTFVGFLPKHAASRKERLLVSATQTVTQIFYVPPHKLQQFLEETSALFGDARKCVIAREITKVHEEFWRGTLSEAKEAFSAHQPKGEITVLIEGKEISVDETPSEAQLEHELSDLISSGHSLSMAVKLVSEVTSVKKKTVYTLALRKFGKLQGGEE